MRDAALGQTMRQPTEGRAHRRRVSRHVRRAPNRRGFDEPIFEDDEREIPLGADEKQGQ
jgi:hypothetical protein